MKCTNYSLPFFRNIVDSHNQAAADYIAAVIETGDFEKWHGNNKMPEIGNSLIVTNTAGETWDLNETLNQWKRNVQEEEGFTGSYPANEENIFNKLSRRADTYNADMGPFTASVLTDPNNKDNYSFQFFFNRDFAKDKAKAMIAVHPSSAFAAMAAASAEKKKTKGSKYFTGYSDIDKYIKALLEHREALYRQRTAVKKNLKAVQDIDNQIETVTGNIEKLKKNADIDKVISIGSSYMKYLRDHMADAETFNGINEGMRLTKAWAELNKVLDFLPGNPDAEEQALLEEAKELQSTAQILYQAYFEKYRDKLLDLIDERLGKEVNGKKVKPSQHLTDDEGNVRILDVDRLGSLGVGMAYSGNEFEQITDMLIKEAQEKAMNDQYEFKRNLEQAVEDFLGKGSRSSNASDFNFLFTKDTFGNSSLITKYDRDFYKQFYINSYLTFDKGKFMKSKSFNYQAAMALGATEEDFKKPKMKTEAFYTYERQHYDYVLTDDGKAAYEKYMADVRETHRTGTDAKGNPIYNENQIGAIAKSYDPEQFEKFLASGDKKDYNNGHKWFSKKLKDSVAKSKDYQALTDKQRKFYDFFTQEFVKGHQEVVQDFRFGDTQTDRILLNFVMGIGGDLGDKAGYMGKQFKGWLQGLAGVRYYDDTNVEGPTRVLSDIKHLGVEFKQVGEFIPDANSTTKAHPLEILENFRQAGHFFKQKREIEDTLNAIRDIVIDAKKIETTGSGEFKKRLGRIFATNQESNVAKRIEYNINAELTGERKDPYKTVTKGGNPGELKFSFEKAVDSINNYTRFKAMALSPMSATGNLIMGGINNWIYASGGQYYSDKDLANAYWMMKSTIPKYYTFGNIRDKNAIKIAELIKRYNIIGDTNDSSYHGDFGAWFFTLQQSGEFLNQGATTIAQMYNIKVKLKDGTEKNLWDLYELDSHDMLVFRSDLIADGESFTDPVKLGQFFEKVRKVNQKVHGDYHNALLIKKDVIGRVLMTFRTWLPMALKERFGAQYTDYVLGEQKGRYLSVGQLTGRAVKNAVKGDFSDLAEFGKLIGKILLPVIGKKIKLGDKLSDIDRANLQMAARELQFLLMLTAATLALHSAAGGDDEDDSNNLLRYLYNQTERAQSELSFFFVPTDTMQIVRDVIPLYQTLRDGWRVVHRSYTWMVDPEEDIYKRGFRKGMSKAGVAWQEFTPVLRSMQKTWSSSEQIFSDKRYQ